MPGCGLATVGKYLGLHQLGKAHRRTFSIWLILSVPTQLSH